MNINSTFSAGGASAPSFDEMKQKLQAGLQKLQKSDPSLAKSVESLNKTIETDVKNGTDPSKDIQSFVKGLSKSQKSELESTFGAPPSGGFPGGGPVRNGKIQDLLGGAGSSSSNEETLLKLLDSNRKGESSASKTSASPNLASLFAKTYGSGHSSGLDLNSLLSSGVTA